jgi:outer membrane receptor protein involved in Fe transport
VRNYNDIFSTIDSRAITGVEAYTGGFPADYGDSMSGVLLLQSQRPDKPRHVELGASVYNTSVLFSGYNDKGTIDWLVSARRSNLDVFLSDDYGKPDYFDIFAEVGVSLNADTRLSFNALYAKDQVIVITESQPDELEESSSDSRNWHLWVLMENQWSADLSSATVISSSHLRSLRDEQVNDPDQYSGTARDDRATDVLGLRQEWQFGGMPGHVLRWGFDLKHHEADYYYRSQAVYDDFFERFPGIENPATSELEAAPSGKSYSLFVSDRWRLAKPTTLQLGLRWDRQTYTSPTFSNQLSPRISLLHELGSGIDLRLSWGRYYQSQAIQQLQIEDGLDHFFPAQRADHWIAGLQYRSAGDYRIRLEAFNKKYSRMKPRFENLFDKLALIPELEPDRVRLDPDSARARGIEIGLEYRGQREISWWLNSSWSKSTDSINGRNERRSWDQRYALQGGFARTHGPWEVGAAVNIHSGWPTTGMTLGIETGEDAAEDEGADDGEVAGEGELEYIPIPGRRNGERVGGFFTIDFRISRLYQLKKSELSVFFEVTNLTNRNNTCCLDYDLDEDAQGNPFLDRTEDTWLPVIPAAGILWEF